MPREDRFTNTPEDAAEFERLFNTPDPEPVDPHDVLDDEELADYYRQHPERRR